MDMGLVNLKAGSLRCPEAVTPYSEGRKDQNAALLRILKASWRLGQLQGSSVGRQQQQVTKVMTKVQQQCNSGIERTAPAVIMKFEPKLPILQLAGETNRTLKRTIKEIGR
jgi:hypothetical protein